MEKITGPLAIDVSLWDDHLNTQELIDGGVKSVIVGMYKMFLRDGTFELNTNSKRLLDQVSASSLILQSYYYYYPDKDPYVEANWWIDEIAKGGWPVKYLWADLEAYKVPMDANVRSERNRMFTDQVASRFGGKTGVYTGKWYIDGYAPQMRLWLPKYPQWLAVWGSQPAVVTPMTWETLKAYWLPDDYYITPVPPQVEVVGHQFTGDKCILPGVYTDTNIRRTLDVSVFKQSFIDSISGAQPPAHPAICPTCGQAWPVVIPPPPTNIYKVLVPGGNAANVRSCPSGSCSIVGVVTNGEIVTIYETSGTYSRIGTGRWVYSAYITKG